MNDKHRLIKYPERDGKEKNTKLQSLIDYLVSLKTMKFTGYIKINCTEGNIGRIEKFEEILKQK